MATALSKPMNGQIRHQLPGARTVPSHETWENDNNNNNNNIAGLTGSRRDQSTMTSVLGSTQAVLEGSLHLSGSTRLVGVNGGVVVPRRQSTVVRAQAQGKTAPVSSRRAVLGLVATSVAAGSFVQAVLSEARPIKVGGPPPPSGGLPGTLNSDEPRDLDLPLSSRFYLQPLPPQQAVVRAKESADDILKVKTLIDKKAWPYVQNDLRLKGEYLRYDLKTVISSKPKGEKEALKQLTDAVFSNINELDHAAKIKSTSQAEKYYAASKSAIGDLFSKLA